MSGIRVGILRGGPSSEHDVSLATGEAMLENLPEHYEPIDVFINKEGTWFVRGTEVRTDRLVDLVDVVLNGLHGEYGEDGKIQRDLDHFNISYTGSGAIPSATAFNKELAKEIFEQHGVKVALHIALNRDEATHERLMEVFKTFPAPFVVKPVASGSSVGASIARTHAELVKSCRSVFDKGFERVLIEEYIKGREATCGVVEDFRGEDYYALPLVEIIPPDGSEFFAADVKYTGETQEICPGNFTHQERGAIQEAAITMHKALGLSHYSRSDFIVSPRGIYALEVNTLPGMTPESLMPKAVNAVGVSFSEFLDHLIQLAHNSRR